ncbi:MBL fold metallo-hydrolase [Paenisporosarcina sp. NPDC076898]|uniref:MBL fold metallo-hydrolase n=1 Tax=unclassified Paenisporosarcina TaxID=2642018 RepID=UPI003D07A533
MILFQKGGLTVFQSALWKTTSSVVETDDLVLVVDPTWLPLEILEIQEFVASIRNDKELYLLFTHGDFDHIIGYQAFLDAKVIGSKGMQEHPRKQYKLDLIQHFDNEYYIERPYPIEFPTLDLVIEKDGQQLILGNTILTFYLSPGHTHDGLFTVIEPLGIWITGDYLSDFELPYLFDSAKAYLETLQKAHLVLDSHNINVLVPGHGQPTGQEDEMKRRIDLAQDYLERLIGAVKSEDTEAILALEKEIPFPSNFTKECHLKNVEIIRSEQM